MATAGNAFNLPAAPPELCFDKNEFAKRTFTVDDFLHVHRHNGASMEAMRDDLGVYLRVLRSAMIELINDDYADFVNLATNLRGLDQQIAGIRAPLEQLRSDIVAVRSTLTDTLAELAACLADRRAVRRAQQTVQALSDIGEAVRNVDRLLVDQSDDDDAASLERAAIESVRIAHQLQFCPPPDAADDDGTAAEVRHSAQTARRRLMDALGQRLVAVATVDDRGPRTADQSDGQLERVLRIYVLLDERGAAEAAVRRSIVAVHLRPIVGEQALQNQPLGVRGVYGQVLAFVDGPMDALLRVGRADRVRGFDFLLRSVWPELQQRIETHMSSIFAPGNPDQFQAKYEATMEFVRAFEARLGTAGALAAFRQDEQYRSFQTRWNLPVYFQIRYQEIGSAVEVACGRPIGAEGTAAKGSAGMRYAAMSVALESVRRCWSNGVYLAPVLVRLWKFTLQIVQRIVGWLDGFVALKEWPGQTNAKSPQTMADALVALHEDVRAFVAQMPGVVEAVLAHLDVDQRAAYASKLGSSLSFGEGALRERLQAIAGRLGDELVGRSAASIRQVNDIPRMYRKTNREVPAKAAGYVEQMLRPMATFDGEHGERLGADVRRALCRNVFGQLTGQYYVAVTDVLTSVQKTEESLRRLKNLREKSAGPTNAAVAAGSSGSAMTDDDKIRLQLQLDVQHWTQAIEQWNVDRTTVDKLPELLAIVEESAKQRVEMAPV